MAEAGAEEAAGADVSETAAGAAAGAGTTGLDWLALAEGTGAGLGW